MASLYKIVSFHAVLSACRYGSSAVSSRPVSPRSVTSVLTWSSHAWAPDRPRHRRWGSVRSIWPNACSPVELQRIGPDRRRFDAAIYELYDTHQPVILGALLTRVGQALAAPPGVELDNCRAWPTSPGFWPPSTS
jgi:hypothetical protein